VKRLMTTIGVAHGGRVRSTEPPVIDLPVAYPKSLGGAGGDATNPEQLLAVGYAACFESALRLVAGMQNLTLEDVEVSAHVTLAQDSFGAFQISVALHARLPNLEHEEARALMEATHHVCPYSNAIRGNVDVQLVVVEPAVIP
jgi:osmotically inducible protein OsmC